MLLEVLRDDHLELRLFQASPESPSAGHASLLLFLVGRAFASRRAADLDHLAALTRRRPRGPALQANMLALTVDVNDIASMYHTSVDTIPDIALSSTLDWQYGDVREVLAVSQLAASRIQDFCLNRHGDIYSANLQDQACSDSALPYPQGYPNYFTPLDGALQVLASYGVSGDITVPALDEYHRKVSLSLLNPVSGFAAGPAVKYCSPLPPDLAPSAGVATGVDYLRYLSRFNTACPPGAAVPSRRRNQQGSGQIPSYASHPTVTSIQLENMSEQPPEDDNGSSVSRRYSLLRTLRRRIFGKNDALTSGPSGNPQRSLLNYSSSPQSDSVNPLRLKLSDFAFDDLGFWKCYSGSSNSSLNPTCWDRNAQRMYDSFNDSNRYGYPYPVFAAIDVDYSFLDEFRNSPTLKALVLAWTQSGGAAPGLKDAGLALRYSVDGTPATCSGAFDEIPEVKAFEYSFKTRLRLWNNRVDEIAVWFCCLQCADSTPRFVSYLNVTDELNNLGHPPLGPCPYVTLMVPLKSKMSSAAVTTLQERLCTINWGSVDERCHSRAWTSQTRNQESEWQLLVTFLSVSNTRAARTSFLFSHEMAKPDIPALFPQIDFSGGPPVSSVVAPWPNPKVDRSMLMGCVSHYDCDDNQFCSTGALQTASQGFLGGGGPSPSNFGCDLCKYCLSDSRDPNDRYCPRDKCGGNAGSYPDCIDAKKLFANFTCQSVYTLNMSRVPVVNTQKQIGTADVVPLSNPNSTARKARFLTPYNQLLGAVTVSQRRRTIGCQFKNDSIGRYSATKVVSLGPICVNEEVSAGPFGVDPAFTSSSQLYQGFIDQTAYYSQTESSPDGTPFGFFPHSYDGKNRSAKDPRFVLSGEETTFKVYFTERISSKQAQRMVTYLSDGGFLDAQTKEVSVEIVTLNSNLNVFGVFTFDFGWQVR